MVSSSLPVDKSCVNRLPARATGRSSPPSGTAWTLATSHSIIVKSNTRGSDIVLHLVGIGPKSSSPNARRESAASPKRHDTPRRTVLVRSLRSRTAWHDADATRDQKGARGGRRPSCCRSHRALSWPSQSPRSNDLHQRWGPKFSLLSQEPHRLAKHGRQAGATQVFRQLVHPQPVLGRSLRNELGLDSAMR